jgi:hypothetical protein
VEFGAKISKFIALLMYFISMDHVFDLFGANKKKFALAVDKWNEIVHYICILDDKARTDIFIGIMGFSVSTLNNYILMSYFMVVKEFESISWYNENVFKVAIFNFFGLL